MHNYSFSKEDHINTNLQNQEIGKTNKKGKHISVLPSFSLFGRLPDYLRVRGLTAFAGTGAGAGAGGVGAGVPAFEDARTRTIRCSIWG